MRKVSLLLLIVVLFSACTLTERKTVEYRCPNCGSVIESRICEICGFDKLWGTTLSVEEAKSLALETPEKIAESIKTAGDAKLFIEQSGLKIDIRSYEPQYGDWFFTRTGYEELITNTCCSNAGFANFVSYVLAGDYKEVGQIKWFGVKDNTINYVYIGGYYPFDINSSYYDCFEEGLDKLKSFGSLSIRESYFDKFFRENELMYSSIKDIFLIVSMPTNYQKPYFVPYYINGKILHVPEKELSEISELYWRYGGESIKEAILDNAIAPYNSRLPEPVNPFPGRVNKNHPLYKK